MNRTVQIKVTALSALDYILQTLEDVGEKESPEYDLVASGIKKIEEGDPDGTKTTSAVAAVLLFLSNVEEHDLVEIVIKHSIGTNERIAEKLRKDEKFADAVKLYYKNFNLLLSVK